MVGQVDQAILSPSVARTTTQATAGSADVSHDPTASMLEDGPPTNPEETDGREGQQEAEGQEP